MKLPEITQIIVVIIVLAFSVSLAKLSLQTFLISALFFVIIFSVNIIAKKLMASYLQAGVETKIWQVQRYFWYERSHFRYPIPAGVILPFVISLLSLGSFPWLAATQSEITVTKSRVAKRHGLYRFTEMTEFQIGLIPMMGILACLILAIIAYLIGQSELGKLAIFFASFNMIPLGNLDGTKIFFGSVIWWFIFAALCVIGLGYAVFLP